MIIDPMEIHTLEKRISRLPKKDKTKKNAKRYSSVRITKDVHDKLKGFLSNRPKSLSDVISWLIDYVDKDK